MRHIIIFLMAALILASTAMASTTIEQLVVNPQEAWLGDALNLSARCLDNETEISRVYTDIQGPGIILPSLDLSDIGDGIYLLSVPAAYFDRRGNYFATVFCTGSETQNASISFSMSELKSQITGITNPIYSADTLEMQFVPKKNDIVLTSGLSISVVVDGQQGQFKIPPIFDTARGWLLRMDSPSVGAHSITVQGTVQGKSTQASATMEVKPIIEFSIVSMDKTVISTGDSITLTVKAANKGTVINLNQSDPRVHIDSTDVNIDSLGQSGNNFNIRITAPHLSNGKYHMIVDMNYNGSIYSALSEIQYVAKISGKFTDIDGKAMSMQMRFFKSNTLKFSINTLSDGSYSSQVIPDIYDVDIDFPDASINLDNADVTSIDDPVELSYDPSAKTEGLVTSGLYSIGIAWKFDNASISLRYNEIFANENNIRVFRCVNYNQKCITGWEKILADLDTRDNKASFSTSGVGTFAVGFEDSMQMTLILDKAKYGKRDLIKVKGSTLGQQSPIGNASITLKIDNTPFQQQLTSDSRGTFAAEFVGPENEGTYTLRAEARKYPLVPFNSTYRLEVVSVPSASIIFPGSIRVEKGKNTTEEIRIVNTGQEELSNIHLEITLDSKYYSLPAYSEKISEKGEIKIPLTLFAYSADAEGTQSAAINFSSDQMTQSKIFGFTIVGASAANETKKSAPATGLAIGQILPTGDFAYILALGAAIIAGAIILKKLKSRRGFGVQYAPIHQMQPERSMQQAYTQPRMQKQKGSDAAFYLSEVKSYLNSRQEEKG